MTDHEFLTAFEDTTLPKAEWTHEAHLRMAFLYLQREAPDRALETVRRRIQAYNIAHGNPRGYHETITTAFFRLLADAVALRPATDFEDLRAGHPHLFASDVLLRHYSRERLYSPEGRAVFVPPDRVPLP